MLANIVVPVRGVTRWHYDPVCQSGHVRAADFFITEVTRGWEKREAGEFGWHNKPQLLIKHADSFLVN